MLLQALAPTTCLAVSVLHIRGRFLNEYLRKFTNWFVEQSDGDWEHGKGIRISTLDNPGWEMDIDLEGTGLEEEPFESLKVKRNEQDWIHCFVRERNFCVRCGPNNLEEGMQHFLEWVKDKPAP